MSVSVTVKSYRVEREKEILDNLQSGMGKAVLIVENQAKINVSKSPPEHPQVQTGRLRASIISQVTEQENEIIGEIGTNVVYGKFLELGTVRHLPYAWLFPAVEMKREEIKDALKSKGFSAELNVGNL